MSNGFRLLMIGAMYENGGNLTHRLLDGHPQMFVYPFESQLGTNLVNDQLSSTFPKKYRWPVFALDATPEQDYAAIIDEECKVRARTPHVSKFRHVQFDFSDEARSAKYGELIAATGRSRPNNMRAFFRATFDVWTNYQRTGREVLHVGYSPIIVVDGERILSDLPEANLLHVVRNPWSAYADTKKRPVPLSLPDYMLGWTLNQYYALLLEQRHPKRVQIVRTEDVMSDPFCVLGAVCQKLGLEPAQSLKVPSWNGTPIDEVYPWGTIRKGTAEANRATAEDLSAGERAEIRQRAWQYLERFDYKSFL